MEISSIQELGEVLKDRGLLGHAAEIGVAEGRTSLEILNWGMGKLYLVDLWQHVPGGIAELGMSNAYQERMYQQCVERLKDFKDRIVILRGWSHEMAKHVPDYSLDFLYIDACHTYEEVRRDLYAWYPKVRSGVSAIIAGHDYTNPALGVADAVHNFVKKRNLPWPRIIPGASDDDGSFWFEKP